MTGDTADALAHLAQQAQLLACLHRLNTLHVFPSIPLGQTVRIQDVADWLNIPTEDLLRLIRFTATLGFFKEVSPGCIEHTTLSAQFVTKPFLVDAISLLAEKALPAALETSKAATIWPLSSKGSEPHDSLVQFKGSSATDMDGQEKLKRQVQAYQRLRGDHFDNTVVEVLSTLDWKALGTAKVVYVNAPSTATAQRLSQQNSHLQVVLQMSDDGQRAPSKRKREGMARSLSGLSSSIQLVHRARSDPQAVKDAQVYILYLAGHSLSQPTADVIAETAAEIQTHIQVLRGNPSARLILISDLLPDPGTADAQVETAARAYDLFLAQLSNGQLFNLAQLEQLLGAMRDDQGKPLHVNHVSSRHGSVTVSQITLS